MALELTEKGRISLEGREKGIGAVFVNGSPTNMPAWENFKNLPKELMRGDKKAITINAIEECFNPIKDPLSGLTLRSSTEQFEVFCESNFIKYSFDDEHFGYIVSFDFKSYLKH